jgi:polysaccharide pyruvyl transferase WcaK-like protein
MTRIVAIGDVGVVNDVIHIGDEAMFEALVTELRSRGIDEIVGISSNPAETANRYGISSIDRIFRPAGRPELRERMTRVLAAASGTESALDADDRAWSVIRGIGDSDGVVIAGGGNLASTWPMHIVERATIGELARRAGVPLVITGQTLGPDLVPEDAELVRSLLMSAELVGVREGASLDLARRWGRTDARWNIDDASYLGTGSSAGDYCLVTISTHLGGADRGQFVDRIVALLESLSLPLRFLAHYGSTDPAITMGDAVLHDVIRERTGGAVITPSTSRAAAADARGAALIVTSRYHPAVFGAAAGVPVIGIPVDDYTTVKLTGALGGRGIVPLAQLIAGDAPSVPGRTAPIDRRAFDTWWDRVAAALTTAR